VAKWGKPGQTEISRIFFGISRRYEALAWGGSLWISAASAVEEIRRQPARPAVPPGQPTLRLRHLRAAGAFGLSPCVSAAHGNRGRSSGGPETAIWAAPCEAHFFDRTSLKPRGAAILTIHSPRERFTVHLRNQSDRSERTPPSASCYELTTRAVSRAPEGQYPLNQTLPGQGSLTTEV
jgi:hypothetical protein